jgi:molybdenum cofactor cytidylyltransferase
VTAPAGILLAAGGSSRLGRDKRRLVFQGKTFLRRAGETLAAVASPALAVVPPGAGEATAELAGLPIDLLVNPDPARGQASSLALAAAALAARGAGGAGVLLLLVDQPLADAELLHRLIAAAAAAEGWAASDYGNGGWGPPAHLPGAALAELAALSGPRGARPLLERRRAAAAGLALVAFPGGRFDVDTEADYARLLASSPG